MSRAKLIISFGLVISAVVILISLGNWQMRRLAWKEDLIATVERQISADPVSLPELERAFAEGQDIEYRPVRLSGHFDHDGESHVLATLDGQSGWHIYTPLTMNDGRSVMINRGFVPYDRKDAATRPESLTEGEISISGLARTAPDAKPGSLVPDNRAVENEYMWKDLAAMTRQAGLDGAQTLPFFVDQLPDQKASPSGETLPIPGVTRIDFPNNHLQYALTWYGLAAALAAVVGGVWLRARKPE